MNVCDAGTWNSGHILLPCRTLLMYFPSQWHHVLVLTSVSEEEDLTDHMQIYFKWWHPFHRHLITVST